MEFKILNSQFKTSLVSFLFIFAFQFYILHFSFLIFPSPVFAQTGTTVPAPPSGIPGGVPGGVPGDAPTSPEDEITEDRDFGSGDNTLETSGGESGGFIDESGGQAGLSPTQYSSQYQGQFFSRITTAREGFAALSNFMLSFLGAVAIVFIIWGGFLYITASGDQAKLDKAKKVLWGTVMSMIIVFGIYALVATLLNIGAALNPGVGVGPLQTGPGGTTLRVPF